MPRQIRPMLWARPSRRYSLAAVPRRRSVRLIWCALSVRYANACRSRATVRSPSRVVSTIFRRVWWRRRCMRASTGSRLVCSPLTRASASRSDASTTVRRLSQRSAGWWSGRAPSSLPTSSTACRISRWRSGRTTCARSSRLELRAVISTSSTYSLRASWRAASSRAICRSSRRRRSSRNISGAASRLLQKTRWHGVLILHTGQRITASAASITPSQSAAMMSLPSARAGAALSGM